MRARLRHLALRLVAQTVRLLRRPMPPAGPPGRILVIKPDHLGDVLLLTPALRLLRQRLPAAEITLLVGPWAADLLRGSDLATTIHICPFPGFTRAAKPSWWQPYWLLWQTAERLRLGRYDVALVARDDHWWGALVALLAGVPRRIGTAAPGLAPLLTTALPYNSAAHVAAQSLALVAALTGGEASTAPPTELPIGAAAIAWAAARLPDAAPQAWAVIQPGAGGAAKLWLVERWVTVGQALEARGLRVVVCGGPGEAALVAAVGAGLAQPLLLTDAPSLAHLAALFRRCALVLGVDSGPLHVAVAAGVPTIALFGPGDPARFGPWGDRARHQVLQSGLWCAPCGVLTACPRGTAPAECMTLIPVAAVLQALDRAPLLDGLSQA